MKNFHSCVYSLLINLSLIACSDKEDAPQVPSAPQTSVNTPPPSSTQGSSGTALTPLPDSTPTPTPTPAPDPVPVVSDEPVVSDSPSTDTPVVILPPPVPETPPAETPVVTLPPEEEPIVVAPAPQIARFITWIDLIEKDLMVADQTRVPDLLYKNKAREKVFNIQALGRIYKNRDPGFKKLHDRFRDLEDAIGDYQKWADYEVQGIANGASATILAKLTANREAGRIQLVNTLKQSHFLPSFEGDVPYTTEARQFVTNYAWPSIEADRKFVVKEMVDELQKTKTAVYDFSHLEDGNGVHEFRRKLRWFSMEARGMNGLFTLKPRDTKCPVSSWSYLIDDSIATTKYAVLPPALTEKTPITITPCLYIKVARLVEDVNGIKAKFEAAEIFSEEVGTDLVAEPDRLYVKALYDDMMANDLIGRLQMELIWGLIVQE